MRLWVIPALVVLLGACESPCAALSERLCACSQSLEANRVACEAAREPESRRRAERAARQWGVDPARVCRSALAAFRCPASASPPVELPAR